MIGPVGSTGIAGTRPVRLIPSGVELPGRFAPQTNGRVADDAGKPPVDQTRVAAIRQAIAEGRYAIDSSAIADRMIAQDLPAE